MKKAENKRQFLTETPVPRLIIRLSIPTIISMLVTAIYNAADTYFVGQISTEATASVGLVFSVMAIIQALGFFAGHGSGNCMSRLLGAGKNEEACKIASTGFAMAAILGVIVAVVGNVLIEPLAIAIGSTPTTMQDTESYMRIILMGAPFMMCQFVINNQLRFQGSAVYAMVGLLFGAVANIILDPLLIFGLDLGVTGAAIATVAGQFTGFVVLFIGSRRGENIRIRIKDIRLSPSYLLAIVNGGAPSLFRQGLAAISTLLLNHYAGDLGGDPAIAGMSIVTRVTMFMASALIGFGQGYQPVCSFNYGAGLYRRVREGYFFCLKWGTVFLTVLSTLCFIFAAEVVGWFRDDPAVIEVGAFALRCQTLSLPLHASIVMTNMMLQSMGRGLKASITSSARNGIFFIPLILLLPAYFGLTGVEITQPIADLLSLLLAIPFAVIELKGLNTEPASPPQGNHQNAENS